jgi:hypothetical protein
MLRRSSRGDQLRELSDDLVCGQRNSNDPGGRRKNFRRAHTEELSGLSANVLAGLTPAGARGAIGIARVHDKGAYPPARSR